MFLVITLIASIFFLTHSEAKTVKSWSPWRFVKTVRFFDAVRLPFSRYFETSSMSAIQGTSGFVLYSIQADEESAEGLASASSWGSLDDVVMGGVSETILESGKFNGRFRGIVRTERNGGFAGIRTKLFSTPLDISNVKGFKITVKGDGQRYKFIARDTSEWNGVAWSKSFDTKASATSTHSILISELKPTKFGRIIETEPFNKINLRGLQVTLSKFEYDGGLNPKFSPGPFSLDIDKIELI